MFDFSGKTVLITGSGAGIGRSAALEFARAGAQVVVNSKSDSAEKVCREICAAGGTAYFIRADVSKLADVKKVVSETVEKFGGLDILVNNAGIVPCGSVEETTEEEWAEAMDTNVTSVFMLCKYFLPYLKQSGGAIVNVVSSVAFKGVKARAAYSATKGAVYALSQSMAAEYVAQGVRVNCVSPGTVYTPSFQGRVDSAPDPEKAMEDFISRQPMGRLGKAEEIAMAILFAATDEVSFMTGANIRVDGGMTV